MMQHEYQYSLGLWAAQVVLGLHGANEKPFILYYYCTTMTSFMFLGINIMTYISLVPRPLPPQKKGPGIYCSRMREIIARMYGKGSVNVSVNGLSHMARS